MKLALALHIPLVVTFHGFDVTVKDEFAARSFYSHRQYVELRPQLIQRGSLFLAVSRFIYNRLIQQGFPETRTVVHYTGVDTEFFSPDSRVKREPIVLFVGRLVDTKGCEFAIRAMGIVQEAYEDARFVVIGDGPLRSYLERMAKELLKRYTFLGIRSPAEVKHWMNRSRVFCVPSVTTYTGHAEGFGMVFAEAQAMGLPVVSFRTGGIPEAVSDGETGFLLEEGDIHGLAKHIQLLLTDEGLWKTMSENGYIRIRRQFDIRMQTEFLEGLYSALN